MIGEITERSAATREWKALFPAMAAGSLLILATGTLGLVVILGASFTQAIVWGFLPFVVLDLIKSVMAGGVSSAFTTKKAYGPEV